ncbi:4'-phosphopantetheinyl transferase family protein [Mesoterricola sediminis]|uniref:4'-phosphopantetheinyl transferase domain-containing protein n=1 Tax=Mesoterricola sediminis TaxID=2927980 RepID=A0AA48H4V2_9BACT|nr:hypothetical protein METESE_09610 [Mesoterricola sediminis]
MNANLPSMGASLLPWITKTRMANLSVAPDRGTKVAIWRVDLREADKFQCPVANGLDPLERSRAARIVDPVDARRWQWAHWAMRRILAYHLNLAPGDIGYRLEGGKPHLRGGPGIPPELDFSLTHSGDWAWLALASKCSIGLDLEQVRGTRDWRPLVDLVCSPAEAGHLVELPEEMRSCFFHRTWVRKEALLKADGVGLCVPCGLQVITTLRDVACLPDPRGGTRTWRLLNLDAPPGYVASLACSGPCTDLQWFDFVDRPSCQRRSSIPGKVLEA